MVVPAWRALRAIVAIAALACAARAAAQAALLPWSGAPAAPALELRDLDGRPTSLAALRGKVVLVNFWATWCEPCVEEMPSLQRLRDRLGTARFEVLAVNHQEGEPRIRTFLHTVPVEFPIVRDTDGAVAQAWNARVFPATFVVDAQQTVRYAAVGALDWSAPGIEQRIRALLPR
jgi:thiol-disulfide isomerase/thioredoxin